MRTMHHGEGYIGVPKDPKEREELEKEREKISLRRIIQMSKEEKGIILGG